MTHCLWMPEILKKSNLKGKKMQQQNNIPIRYCSVCSGVEAATLARQRGTRLSG